MIFIILSASPNVWFWTRPNKLSQKQLLAFCEAELLLKSLA
ncbi:MAG: hypothetical protein AAF927_06530 [Bacteroidota bacterium]